MTYAMAWNPFVSDSLGPDYETPMSRGFGFSGAVLHNAPRRFSRIGFSLPRWLNFKTAKSGTQPNLKAEVHSLTTNETKVTIPCQDRVRRNSNRSSKSSTSSNTLRRKVEELQLKTKTEEWKQHRRYERVRERRQLRTKRMNRKLRIVRRFYYPSMLFVVLGVVGIFGSTVRSIGEGTVFWTYQEHFRIIGLVVTVVGVIFLLITVGVESQTAQAMKRKKIFETDPLIHPDFLREPNLIERQTSQQSSTCSFDI